MMKRKGQHGHGMYSIPGGAVDAGEGIEQAAQRELEEETGLVALNLKCLGITNNLTTYDMEGVHVASVIFYSKTFSGNLTLKEPSKHEELAWYPLSALPSPLFEASELALEMLWETSPNASREPLQIKERLAEETQNLAPELEC